MAGAGILIAQPHAHHAGLLLGDSAVGSVQQPGGGLGGPIQPGAGAHGGGIHPLELDVQPDHCAIGGGQAGIDISTQVGAVAALRAEEDVGPACPLHHAHAVVGRAVRGSIATQDEGIAVATATAARENYLLHQVYILDREAGQIGQLLAVCTHGHAACTRRDGPGPGRAHDRPPATCIGAAPAARNSTLEAIGSGSAPRPSGRGSGYSIT